MKRKRHSEEQTIAILKEHEAGVKTADLCRKHGISEQTFYNWKAKYGGLEVAKRLRGLESESAPKAHPRNFTVGDYIDGPCLMALFLNVGGPEFSE